MSLRPVVLVVPFIVSACTDGLGDSGDAQGEGDGGASDGGAGDFVLPQNFGALLHQHGCEFGVELGANDPDQTLGVKLNARDLMVTACAAEGRSATESRPAGNGVRVVRGTLVRDALCPLVGGENDAVIEEEFAILRGTIEITVTADEAWCNDPPSATMFGTGKAVYKDVFVDGGGGTEVAMGPMTVGPMTMPTSPPTGGGG